MKTRKDSGMEEILPMFKSVSLMCKVSGIGENTLRQLMDTGKLEYLQVGNRRLLYDSAILDYYQRHKTPVRE